MYRFLKDMFTVGSRQLRDFERVCVTALAEQLPEDLRSVIDTQLLAVEFVYRENRDKLVSFKIAGDSLPKVPNRQLELLVGYCVLLSSSGPVRADVLFENGVVAGLKFSQGPRKFEKEPWSVSETVLVASLESQQDEAPLVEGPMLSRIGESIDIFDLHPPARPEFIDAFIRRLQCPVPEDYVALLRETNGFKFGDKVFEGTQQRMMVWPDENLQLAAEDPACIWALCFRESHKTAQVFLLDEPNAETKPIGNRFVEALIAFGGLEVDATEP